MISINEHAPQLGNRLFAMAAAITLAEHNRDSVHFPPAWKYYECFEGDFSSREPYPDFVIKNVYHEPHFHFAPIPYHKNIELTGYFQSEKYFKSCESKIRQMYTIKKEYKKVVNDSLSNFLNKGQVTCSIHVRRGDYATLEQFHPMLGYDYYREAISIITTKYGKAQFFVFSDDLEWCRNNFPNSDKFTIMEGSVIQDLSAMSSCDHHIIANSSFSWWGAWLNPNKNKTVITPKRWFGPAYHYHQLQDLIPEEWMKI